MNGRASVADADRIATGGNGGAAPSPQGADARRGEPDQRDGSADGARGTYLSLFSGVGGLDLAVEAFGYRCAGQVEIDGWCRSQLERHWPAVRRWGDVAEVSTAQFADALSDRREPGREAHAEGLGRPQPRTLASPLGACDLICGGFPCQPVSHAGRRKGQADARWLWPEYARLVGELRPRVVVVENVPGLLSIDGGRAVSEVVGDLASMGYVGRHGTVRASDVGAPHRRERFFLVAYALSDGLEGLEPDGTAPGPTLRGRNGIAPDPQDTDGWSRGESRSGGSRIGRRGSGSSTAWGPYEPAIRRWERVMGPAPAPLDSGRLSANFVEWMMGLPHGWTEGKRNQRLKALGNAVVPQQATYALSLLGLEHLRIPE